MIRVYVAGAYSANNPISIFDNMRKGMRLATEVLLAGCAPFCPWLDFHFQLMLRPGEELDVQDYYEYSLAWLSVSDALLLVPAWEKSIGTARELDIASKLGIPIFHNLDALLAYFKDFT